MACLLGTELPSLLEVVSNACGARASREAGSDAFVDNEASNRVSRGLGYEPNGTDWDTRRGEPARIQQWRLTRDAWERVRRDDIKLTGVEECLPVLGIG